MGREQSGDGMTDEDTRTINRAISLLGDEHQDEREAARTALHHVFGRQVRAEKEKAHLNDLYDAQTLRRSEAEAELERLREENEVYRNADTALRARLHRIEEAARKVELESRTGGHRSLFNAIDDLRAALEER